MLPAFLLQVVLFHTSAGLEPYARKAALFDDTGPNATRPSMVEGVKEAVRYVVGALGATPERETAPLEAPFF